jgi:predicted CoA-binding protein
MNNQALKDFVTCKSVAVVGASATKKKYGNTALRELRTRGFDVLAVHPTAKSIDGISCFPSLAALPSKPDGVFVCVQPEKVKAVLREAAAAGIPRVWLQQGAESPAADDLARELGLHLVSGVCILMYMQPVRGIHALHRGVMRLFRRLHAT